MSLRIFIKRVMNFSIAQYPSVPPLGRRHLKNCVLLPSRDDMLGFLKKRAVCAEVGVLSGDFSQLILEKCQPSELHLIDLKTRKLMERFGPEMQNGQVVVKKGLSWEVLSSYPDRFFDWIYIDASHDYQSVKKDIDSAFLKVKEDDILVFNDYQYLCPNSYEKYGVIEAVNEFCLRNDWELVYFCLQGRGFYDVAIRRIV